MINDPIIADLIDREKVRQQTHLEMIASENFASPSVMEAQGSVLTNKYAEGLPNKRYYGGCEFVDEIEELAIERAKKLFGAKWANVQPHSGAQANLAVFLALLKPGDTIMGMDLSHGGHLTHGSHVNISGKWFRAISYQVDKDTQVLDYNRIKQIAIEEKPKLIITGYSAYPRQIDFKAFREIADRVDAYLHADIAHIAGIVAKGLHLSNNEELGKKLDKAVFPGTQGGPLEHVIAAKAVAFGEALTDEFGDYIQQVLNNSKVLADTLIKRGINIVSGGSDNHIVLLDLRSIGMTGKVADALVSGVNITANKNTVPFDPESPFVTSGLRLGTSALTTRGFDQDAFIEVGNIIADVLLNPNDATKKDICKERVLTLCKLFPLYE